MVVSTSEAFAAVKQDGSVVTWGDPLDGGNCDKEKSDLQGGVLHVVGTLEAFTAIKEDGSVAW